MGAFEIWVCEMWMFGNLTAFSVGVSLNFRQEVGRKKERREAHIPLKVSEPTISTRHSHSPNVNATNVSY
jgi:hypothetical protein